MVQVGIEDEIGRHPKGCAVSAGQHDEVCVAGSGHQMA